MNSILSKDRRKYFEYIILGLLFMLVPTLNDMGILRAGHVTIIGTTLIYTIAALGLNILLGYGGLLSLGTAGFMGLAAYTSAYITENLGLTFEVALIVAVAVPTLLGVLVGVLSLKFEGIYLGIATLVVSEIFREIFLNVPEFTNATSGALAGFPQFLIGDQLTRRGMYYFIVIVMIIMFIIMYNVTKGHIGRALNAMRGSESSAQAMGVNLFKYRLIAFGLATMFASVAGVLYVHYIGISYPTTWTLNLSLDILAIIVIGGFRSIRGTLVGAFIIYGLTEIVLKPIPIFASMSPVIKGVLIILFVLYYPNGIAHLKYDVRNWYNRITKKEVAENE
ncbi:branched-chain amino acid ABC transporter permease [Fundicoccus culcitae]|uniref:Branched-chain amino acid ABC transporter permease n=1 Tax=Fundicoccus culcitae TaxID=2969821 RepID=A0ABY5P8S1_9LACT|nr:branched-chain amino acid ABC transporter permease [Fundicoccus culcitae]UUX34981.1 branched-chain amino acid ABC transporter permease [Fundicoccus culcitae]